MRGLIPIYSTYLARLVNTGTYAVRGRTKVLRRGSRPAARPRSVEGTWHPKKFEYNTTKYRSYFSFRLHYGELKLNKNLNEVSRRNHKSYKTFFFLLITGKLLHLYKEQGCVQTCFGVTGTAGTVHYDHKPETKQGNLLKIAFPSNMTT